MKGRGAAEILSAVQLVTVAGAVALALHRVVTVTWIQALAPFDLSHEVPIVSTIVLLRHGVGYRLERTGIFQYYIRRDASHPVQSEPTPLGSPPALAEPEPGRVGAAVGPRWIYPR